MGVLNRSRDGIRQAGGAALRAAADLNDRETRLMAERYLRILGLEHAPLYITTERREFESLLGRRIDAGVGGAYAFHGRRQLHLVLINLRRIDRSLPRAVELVVAEELLHMRDWIDGDRRRHAKHGYDRIAHRVSALTGASLEEIRSCLLPRQRRPVRYLYRCPGCDRTVERRLKGTWSCSRCAPSFDWRFVLRLERDLREGLTTARSADPIR